MNWVSNAGIGFVFLYSLESEGGRVGIWLFCAVVNLTCVGVIYWWLPETKGKPLETGVSFAEDRKEIVVEMKHY